MTVCKRNGVNLNNAIKVAAISAVMSVLAACGDDSSTKGTEPTDSDVIAATFDDLPVCSEKRQGAVGYVKDKKITYVCEDGRWVSDGEDSSSSNHCEDASKGCDKAISSSSKAKSSSSKKTSSSSLESKAKSSSSVSKTSSSSSVKINSSSSKIKSSSSSGTKEGSSTRDTISVTAIKNKSVSGVSQKGPYVTGSVVKLYELDGKTYAQTGKSFTGKIASDDGKFSVSSVTLASQYALLEANGYFRNEVTGKKSSGIVTLNALTDLSAREKVNVNLLTHLEYERALYLVGTGVNVSAAKKQAETEIFNAFGIQGNFANSEDLDIFSKGEGNAALLAFSVLMLRDLSEADLTELLTKFAIDIEKDGKWNDEATKAKIADWAQSKDVAGTLAYIRSNIEKWNLGTVPEFEKFVRNFWYTNYGLGDCDKVREGEVIAAKNELSSTYGTQSRFICKSGAWVEASDIEKNTYGNKCSSTEVGKTIEGVVADTNKYYCTANGWVKITTEWSWDIPKEARLNSEITYGTMTDSRDGKKYKTVTIGNQTWMAENLNYADSARTPSLKENSWCFDNDTLKCNVTGRLYTWTAAIDSVKLATNADNPQDCGYSRYTQYHLKFCTLPAKVQGICPPGWHLPNNTEWDALFTGVGGQSFAGRTLKSQSSWSDYDGEYGRCSGNGMDAFGFSALPAGRWSRLSEYSGIFNSEGRYTFFWSFAEQDSANYVYEILLDYGKDQVYLSRTNTDAGFSVRCLKD